MSKIKEVLKYFQNVVLWLDAHKIYGGFVFVFMLIAFTLSGYALNKEESLGEKVDSVQTCIDLERNDNLTWRANIENRMNVMDAKLDLLVELGKK